MKKRVLALLLLLTMVTSFVAASQVFAANTQYSEINAGLNPAAFASQADIAAAAGSLTPVLTDGKITGHEIAPTVNPDAIRFNNLEWTGLASVPAGLPNQGRQSQVYEVNRVKPHADLLPYDTVQSAVTGAVDYDKARSKYYLPLTTKADLDPVTSSWKFSRVDTLTKTLATANATKDPWNPSANIVDFYKTDYDASKWPGVAVPTSWQLQGVGPDGVPFTGYYDPEYGYDPPYFTNINMPGSVNFQGKGGSIFNGITIPEGPNNFNPVGFYRRNFDVPADWIADKNKVFISIDGAEAAFYVYLNGKEVGYHEDSKTPGEFDLTPFLTADGKNNLLGIKVFRWADCSWFDDQDMIRFGGITRNVWLMATPPLHIRDYKVETDMDATFTDATLKLDVWARNYTSNLDFSDYGVMAQLFDADGVDILQGQTIVLPFSNLISDSEVKVSGSVPVTAPHLWFPDDPYLYTLVLSVYNMLTNVAVERISQQLGFRKITYRTAANATDIIRINGQKIMFMGTNRHGTSPEGGHYSPPERIYTDLLLMKQNNLNAIRTSHYPEDTYLYYLADKWGLMIMDEANNESHANTSSSLSTNNFYDMVNSRTQNIVQRDKNRTSVVMWSLGNESGNQAGFRTIIGNIRPVDNTRPVHYEPIGNNTTTNMDQMNDVRSSMYTSPSGFRSNCTSSAVRSAVLCEYDHSNGNAVGNERDYLDVFRSEPRCIGGFTWDYVDQSAWTKPASTGYITEKGPYNLKGNASSAIVTSVFASHTGSGYSSTLRPGAYVTYPNTAGTGGQDIFNEYIQGRKPFSVEVWASPTDLTSQAILVAKGDNQFALKYRNNNELQFTIYSTNAWVSATAPMPSNITNGQMHHFVGSFDGTTLRLYYDGSLLASTALTAAQNISTSSYAFGVGRELQNSRSSVSYIAGARVYSRALTDAEARDATRGPSDPVPADDGVIFWEDFTKAVLSAEIPKMWDIFGNGLYLGYGGDWGEGNTDGDNCADGMITATRDEQPEIVEYKKAFQPLWFTATDTQLTAGIVNVRNELYATNGNTFKYTWILTENGAEISRGVLDNVPNMPAAKNGMDVFYNLPTVAINIPYQLPATLRPGAEYHLNIEASMKTATEWAQAGHVVATEQFLIPAKSAAGMPAVPVNNPGEIKIEDGDTTLKLSGIDFSVEFNKANGMMTNYTAGGQTLLTEGPRPQFWRAPSNADMQQVTNNPWTNIDINLPLPSFSTGPSADGLSVVVVVNYALTAINANSFVDMKYTVYLNGAINVTSTLRTNSTLQLFRFGADMIMPPGYENIEWFTVGPQDNFFSRDWGVYSGRYQTTVSDNFFPFITPQNCGAHLNTRWMALTGGDTSVGLLVAATGARNFEANAMHFGWRDMAPGGVPVRHPYMLSPKDHTVVSVGFGSRSCGGRNFGMPTQYTFPANGNGGSRTYSYTLVPFTAGDDLQTLADSYKTAPELDILKPIMLLTTTLEDGTVTARLRNIKIEDTPVALIAAVYDRSNGKLVYIEEDNTQTSIKNETLVKVFNFDAGLYPDAGYIIKVFAWEKDTYIPLTSAGLVTSKFVIPEPPPTIGITITTTAPVTSGEEVVNLIDNTTGTKWYTSGAFPLNVYIEFSEPVTIDSFRIGTANDSERRDPRLFTIGGSNTSGGASATYTTFYTHDGTNLTTTRYALTTFPLSQPVTYRYFRMQITDVRNPGNGTQMSEFNLIGAFNRAQFS